MLAKTHSFGISGLDAYMVTIEVDVTKGLPGMSIVGLPDSAIRESKDRVRSAIKNCGYIYKPRRVTVNLSPANTKKEGPAFDLAIAIGILAATEQIICPELEQFAILGEMSLDGSIQPIRGSLSAALAMKNKHLKGLIIPQANASETSITDVGNIYPVKTLEETIQVIANPSIHQPQKCNRIAFQKEKLDDDLDFIDVKGQTYAKRGLEIAAAGSHNCLMIGPPGSGKSMLAKRFPTILPDMSLKESLETTRIHSVMGQLKNAEQVVARRPFRSPHHTTSDIALIGGGSNPKPGEVTLSHNGVLFLDELPEFNRNVLEVLRQPLEEHYVIIARANNVLRFPSRFILLCAMNPCPCGWYTDSKRECQCLPNQIQKYMSKISGPLLDRIDLHLEVPALPASHLLKAPPSESSCDIKNRTSKARTIQQKRFARSAINANAYMGQRQIKSFCKIDQEGQELLKGVIENLGLSARAHDKILKIARTIADLDHSEKIQTDHLAEAVQFRCLDRGWWG